MTKRLRVQLIGTGKVDDPCRAALPTYRMIDVDYGARTAIVDVPDDCYPPAPKGEAETVTADSKFGNVITDVTLEHALDAAAFFDDKYEEHVGKFGLDVK